jgi:hypothetical protein
VEVQMNMHQPSNEVVMAEETQDGRVIPVRDGRKELQTRFEQDGFATVLIFPRDKKVEVAFARQNGIDAPAAFPETIGDAGLLKTIEDCQQDKRNRAPRGRVYGRFKFSLDVYRPHGRPLRLQEYRWR